MRKKKSLQSCEINDLKDPLTLNVDKQIGGFWVVGVSGFQVEGTKT